jgi:hypothetical protein
MPTAKPKPIEPKVIAAGWNAFVKADKCIGYSEFKKDVAGAVMLRVVAPLLAVQRRMA